MELEGGHILNFVLGNTLMPYDEHNLGFLAVKELLDFEKVKPVYKFLS